MLQQESIQTIAGYFDIKLKETDFAANKNMVAARVNELIQTDFQKLISILYRLDVSEEKLKRLLKDHPGTDAGLIITELIIERQIEKIKSRREFTRRDKDIDEEDKW